MQQMSTSAILVNTSNRDGLCERPTGSYNNLAEIIDCMKCEAPYLECKGPQARNCTKLSPNGELT